MKTAKTAKKRSAKQRTKTPARKKTRALVPRPREPEADCVRPTDRTWAGNDRDQLLGDLPGITLKDEHEVFFHFERIDPRLAEAWKRDVVVHKGPITLRRVMDPACFGGATHYAYVDPRLLWYLKHDQSDQLGARWEGYLRSPGDAPSGTIAVFVGSNILVKRCLPQLEE